jgi:hypothetical protein
MGATEYMIIISGLATAVTTLAGLLWTSERSRRIKAERQADQLVRIIVGQAAKRDETMGEFARFLEQKGYE